MLKEFEMHFYSVTWFCQKNKSMPRYNIEADIMIDVMEDILDHIMKDIMYDAMNDVRDAI